MKRTLARWNKTAQMPELNLTSMIDVIFLLLIFFVLTANFNEIEQYLQMRFSRTGNTAAADNIPQPETGETIHIRAESGPDGRLAWSVEGVLCSGEEDLRETLGGYDPSAVSAVIHPSESSPAEQVLDLYGICSEAGVTNIRFAAGRPAPAQQAP